jgi:RNA polymerase sigma-54 factor
MDLRLVPKTIQTLVLTPSLQQAIKLLQYSRQELVQYVQQELLENPTLEEIAEQEEDQADDSAEAEQPEPATEPPAGEESGGEERDVVEELAGDGEPEADWSDFLPEFDNGFEPYNAGEAPSYENVLAAGTSLQEHLLQQLNISFESDREKEIGFELVGNIDDSGYLRVNTEEVAERLQARHEEVEDVLRLVQDFDPPGVAARDLQECLALQLAGMGLEGGLEDRIVGNHLKDLEARRLKKIVREQKATLDEVVAAARVIAALEPRPGRAFSREAVQHVVPDIRIYKMGGTYEVQLIDEGLPQLRVNGFYRRLYRSGKLTPKDKEFIEKKVNSAKWLIKSILQRQQTILKVARSIVRFQEGFLDHGIKHLRPLVLRTVAEDIEMHESTVSRVTNRKYTQTPQGVLELKYFFNSGISTREGGSMASISVMDIIKGMIEEEDSQKPLSDLEIVRLLQEEHSLSIARRTVAKYRGLLHIFPASRRRQAY